MHSITNGTILNCTETGSAFIALSQHGDSNYIVDQKGRIFSIEGAVARTRRAVIECQLSKPRPGCRILASVTRH